MKIIITMLQNIIAFSLTAGFANIIFFSSSFFALPFASKTCFQTLDTFFCKHLKSKMKRKSDDATKSPTRFTDVSHREGEEVIGFISYKFDFNT